MKNLDKDTMIFVIFNPKNMLNMKRRNSTVENLNSWGYTNIRFQPYGKTDEDYGYKPVFGNEVSEMDRVKWYAYLNILRKIRKEDKPVIITFAGNELVSDIPQSITESEIEILGYTLVDPNTKEKKSNANSGVFITPSRAIDLFKHLLNKRLDRPIHGEMIAYYRDLYAGKEYNYFLMKNA